ncbi:unnamed protein product [Anisakis simplex]|uniref:G_PROTEIN_RECEP_F3_4 domain-containing protein n=1 Tax=Anisakis simplex TaxID=6269 RepID=A0A0M3JZM1_ANISI|nr:unnamed protein product [Anisakis simplex]
MDICRAKLVTFSKSTGCVQVVAHPGTHGDDSSKAGSRDLDAIIMRFTNRLVCLQAKSYQSSETIYQNSRKFHVPLEEISLILTAVRVPYCIAVGAARAFPYGSMKIMRYFLGFLLISVYCVEISFLSWSPVLKGHRCTCENIRIFAVITMQQLNCRTTAIMACLSIIGIFMTFNNPYSKEYKIMKRLAVKETDGMSQENAQNEVKNRNSLGGLKETEEDDYGDGDIHVGGLNGEGSDSDENQEHVPIYGKMSYNKLKHSVKNPAKQPKNPSKGMNKKDKNKTTVLPKIPEVNLDNDASKNSPFQNKNITGFDQGSVSRNHTETFSSLSGFPRTTTDHSYGEVALPSNSSRPLPDPAESIPIDDQQTRNTMKISQLNTTTKITRPSELSSLKSKAATTPATTQLTTAESVITLEDDEPLSHSQTTTPARPIIANDTIGRVLTSTQKTSQRDNKTTTVLSPDHFVPTSTLSTNQTTSIPESTSASGMLNISTTSSASVMTKAKPLPLSADQIVLMSTASTNRTTSIPESTTTSELLNTSTTSSTPVRSKTKPLSSSPGQFPPISLPSTNRTTSVPRSTTTSELLSTSTTSTIPVTSKAKPLSSSPGHFVLTSMLSTNQTTSILESTTTSGLLNTSTTSSASITTRAKPLLPPSDQLVPLSVPSTDRTRTTLIPRSTTTSTTLSTSTTSSALVTTTAKRPPPPPPRPAEPPFRITTKKRPPHSRTKRTRRPQPSPMRTRRPRPPPMRTRRPRPPPASKQKQYLLRQFTTYAFHRAQFEATTQGKGGLIAGIIIGFLVIIGAVFAALFVTFRMKKNQVRELQQQPSVEQLTTSEMGGVSQLMESSASEWAPDKINATQFNYKGPLRIPFKQPLILKHDLDDEKVSSEHEEEHVQFDDSLNEVHEMGSEIEVVVFDEKEKNVKSDEKTSKNAQSRDRLLTDPREIKEKNAQKAIRE